MRSIIILEATKDTLEHRFIASLLYLFLRLLIDMFNLVTFLLIDLLYGCIHLLHRGIVGFFLQDEEYDLLFKQLGVLRVLNYLLKVRRRIVKPK